MADEEKAGERMREEEREGETRSVTQSCSMVRKIVTRMINADDDDERRRVANKSHQLSATLSTNPPKDTC